jgi:hypothetical protein
MTEIYFNSKSGAYWQLSNFYGNVEMEYMRDRFLDNEIQMLFEKMKSCSKDEFLHYLVELQPEKRKKWTDKKMNYWLREDVPIYGILAKLIGTSVRDTPTGKRRRKIIQSMAGMQSPLRIKPNTTDEEKKEFMLELLREKFKNDCCCCCCCCCCR